MKLTVSLEDANIYLTEAPESSDKALKLLGFGSWGLSYNIDIESTKATEEREADYEKQRHD